MCEHALKVNDLQDMIKAMTQKDQEKLKNNDFFNLKIDDLVQMGTPEDGADPLSAIDAANLTREKLGQLF